MERYFLHVANNIERIRRADDNARIPNNFKEKIIQEFKSWESWRAVLAEFIATLMFVFIGTMSAAGIVPVVNDWAKIVRIAFTFGLMIAVCIQMFGHVSGGHMNPAVSLAMAVAMEITPSRAVLYIVAQCVGGILGSLLLKGVTPSALHGNLGLTSVNSELTEGQGFMCEFVFTFILVMSIFGTTDSNRALLGSPALGIGLTVGVVHLAAIPFTGASMNPARSLASSAISTADDSFDKHWVYWVGPLLGGVIAAVVYKYLFSPYRGKMTVAEATNKMMESHDMIVIPRTYFKDDKSMNTGNDEKSLQVHL
ncbi:aquaporin AQPAe.a-like isoform X4 [Mercenaria mercenaria]|uniref:aquaporin AQPAe.a-like isoform X4 n=1 Tax=Mercenaria mercenaria TaxID=6596 RepID=UPI00234E9909|nr:aquaporin AQPAe.a-like isoform X4 [Mercenaria mercenaria]